MFAKERHQLILQALADAGRVEVLELAARWEVSEDTIRRDLREMAANGLLHKTHGGAVPVAGVHVPMRQRQHLASGPKSGIGRRAAKLVEAGQTIILDAGATTLALAGHLTVRPLRVVTNALDIATLLSDDADIELVLLGGQWSRHDRHFSGQSALDSMALLRADLAFIGVCALDVQMGVTAHTNADAQLKRCMVAHARRAVLVAEASKWGQVAPYAVGALSAFEQWVTDQTPVGMVGEPIAVTLAGNDESRA
jgi:DeoR/GlpR family transcriptional regulator of sugar metabolism